MLFIIWHDLHQGSPTPGCGLGAPPPGHTAGGERQVREPSFTCTCSRLGPASHHQTPGSHGSTSPWCQKGWGLLPERAVLRAVLKDQPGGSEARANRSEKAGDGTGSAGSPRGGYADGQPRTSSGGLGRAMAAPGAASAASAGRGAVPRSAARGQSCCRELSRSPGRSRSHRPERGSPPPSTGGRPPGARLSPSPRWTARSLLGKGGTRMRYLTQSQGD